LQGQVLQGRGRYFTIYCTRMATCDLLSTGGRRARLTLLYGCVIQSTPRLTSASRSQQPSRAHNLCRGAKQVRNSSLTCVISSSPRPRPRPRTRTRVVYQTYQYCRAAGCAHPQHRKSTPCAEIRGRNRPHPFIPLHALPSPDVVVARWQPCIAISHAQSTSICMLAWARAGAAMPQVPAPRRGRSRTRTRPSQTRPCRSARARWANLLGRSSRLPREPRLPRCHPRRPLGSDHRRRPC
jgi:hypothetical protein